MNNFETAGPSMEEFGLERRRLTIDEVDEIINQDGNFDDVSIAELNMARFILDGKSFKRADARGLALYFEDNEDRREAADIRNTDWTDADLGDSERAADFRYVEAAGSTFGFTETLKARRERLIASDKGWNWNDCGAYNRFVGNEGNFQRTRWDNIDFGGETGTEALFINADLEGAVFQGCALRGIDLSWCNLKDVRIIAPASLAGMTIGKKFIADVANGISFCGTTTQENWLTARAEKGDEAALKDFCLIEIVE